MTPEIIDEVRRHAEARLEHENDTLEFYTAARDLGLSHNDADKVATHLNRRVTRATGVI